MTNGEQITGTRDEHYNLVSVLYHSLQAGETAARAGPGPATVP